ncbi:MAG: type II toxin-antitoxin system RelE/ParE family toxin [Candidatus Syntrophoarchaeum sp. WYZ-LMO15]|nr:MAG: type II toxin-antitoxin system RelE/ParE family toxin [Candidatus Syntrophoarchaeum sp. WYZ-LMO15]
MSYRVKVHRRVEKFLKTIPKKEKERIKVLILSLENPYEVPHVRVKGEKGVYRARVGKYRILYSVFEEEGLVLVLKVDKRERVYG